MKPSKTLGYYDCFSPFSSQKVTFGLSTKTIVMVEGMQKGRRYFQGKGDVYIYIYIYIYMSYICFIYLTSELGGLQSMGSLRVGHD